MANPETNRTKQLVAEAKQPRVAPKDRADADLAKKALKTEPAPANQFGAYTSLAAQPRPAKITLSLASLVERYQPNLASPEEVEIIRAAIAEHREHQRAVEFHSVSLHNDRVRRASLNYATDPSPENQDKLQKLKAIGMESISVANQAAHGRKEATVAGLAELEGQIYLRFAECLERDALIVSPELADRYAEFGCEVPADPLAAELSAMALRYRTIADHRDRGCYHGPELPDLLVVIAQQSETK